MSPPISFAQPILQIHHILINSFSQPETVGLN